MKTMPWIEMTLSDCFEMNTDFWRVSIDKVKITIYDHNNRNFSVVWNAAGPGHMGSNLPGSALCRYFIQPPNFTSDIFAAPWPKSMFSTSFERSTSYLFGAYSSMPSSDF